MITATEWLSSVRNVGGVRGRGAPFPAKRTFCYLTFFNLPRPAATAATAAATAATATA